MTTKTIRNFRVVHVLRRIHIMIATILEIDQILPLCQTRFRILQAAFPRLEVNSNPEDAAQS